MNKSPSPVMAWAFFASSLSSHVRNRTVIFMSIARTTASLRDNGCIHLRYRFRFPREGKRFEHGVDIGGGKMRRGLSQDTIFRVFNDELGDRKSVVEGKSVSVRVDLGGGGYIKKKK